MVGRVAAQVDPAFGASFTIAHGWTVTVAGALIEIGFATTCTVPLPAHVSFAVMLAVCVTTTPLSCPQASALVVHATCTLVMSAVGLLPLPPVTAQVWAGVVGCVCTVTVQLLALSIVCVKVKLPLAATGSTSPLLDISLSPVPARPETVPPRWIGTGAQVTATLVTSCVPTVPDPAATVQVCSGIPGGVLTVTA